MNPISQEGAKGVRRACFLKRLREEREETVSVVWKSRPDLSCSTAMVGVDGRKSERWCRGVTLVTGLADSDGTSRPWLNVECG